MSRRKLTSEEARAAERLTALFLAQKEKTGLSQLALALACGWQTQGTVSQYLLGKIPLNAEAVVRFANFFKVPPAEIYPELASGLGMTTTPNLDQYSQSASTTSVSPKAQELIELIAELDRRNILSADAIDAVKTLLSSIAAAPSSSTNS